MRAAISDWYGRCGQPVYDVTSITEILAGIDDERVIDIARSEQRLLLTEDKDFGQLVYSATKENFRRPAWFDIPRSCVQPWSTRY